MIIAVNTIFPAGAFVYGVTNYIEEIFSKLVQQSPQHQFIFFVDKNFNAPKNSTSIIISTSVNSPIRLQYFLNYKIPALLKKHKAAIFISAGGYCSLHSKVPQCIIINDLSFLQYPKFFTGSWLRFYKTKTTKFLNKANIIITTSQFLQQQITAQYKIAADKIQVAYHGVNENFRALTWQEKDATKKIYTEDVEYFLYSGPIEPQKDLVQLLKAFSFFKKRQKSNMQLILASTVAATDKAFIKSLASFKYKAAVHVVENASAETVAAITGAAYAMVYPCSYDGAGASLMQAMQAEVPIICASNSAIAEICGDAALYCNIADFNDIADKMMLVFKDEDKRNQIISKGKQQVTQYHWDKTAAIFGELIAQFAN